MAEEIPDGERAVERYPVEAERACRDVEQELIPDLIDAPSGDTVELTPDGMAVVDGAFRAHDLIRVAEACVVAMERASPTTGLTVPEKLPAELSGLDPAEAVVHLVETLDARLKSQGVQAGPVMAHICFAAGFLIQIISRRREEVEKAAAVVRKLADSLHQVETAAKVFEAGGLTGVAEFYRDVNLSLGRPMAHPVDPAGEPPELPARPRDDGRDDAERRRRYAERRARDTRRGEGG